MNYQSIVPQGTALFRCHKMKAIILLLISVTSIVNCNPSEFLQLSRWLSKPDFDFSRVPAEEKSLCQKHLELYTKSLNGSNGIPKSWAMKSEFSHFMFFQI